MDISVFIVNEVAMFKKAMLIENEQHKRWYGYPLVGQHGNIIYKE